MKTHIGSVRGNLPLYITSFTGRECELAELKHLPSIAQVIMLTEASGCGKTPLALQYRPKVVIVYDTLSKYGLVT